MTQSATYPLTLYYESACALCDSEIRNMMLRNPAGLLKFVDVSAPNFNSRPPGTTQADLERAIHATTADGRLVIGVDVFRLAYRAIGLPSVSRALSLPGLRQVADWLYPFVARNRHRIPRFIPHLLFETQLRRAAERAAQNAHCTAATCPAPSISAASTTDSSTHL